MEHDVFIDTESNRYVKVTRHGVFGLNPGIELALVPSDQDARRFQLWEATPRQYLERLRLHNTLVPGINRLEGFIHQGDDLAICISQPRFEILPATAAEIGAWFATLGFEQVAKAAYYRREDNLGIFDAHDKNVLRSADPDILIPFDVIPVHPDEGFLDFIQDTLAADRTLTAKRTVRTTTRTHST